MTFSRRGPLPLYHQLKSLITEKIQSGEWTPGYKLQSEVDMSSEFNISRATVRQTMQLLENEGLVERIQGRGTFVGRPKMERNLLALLHHESAMGQSDEVPSNELHHIEKVTPSPLVASRLQLRPGAKVYEVSRTVEVDGPLMLITSWLPAKQVPDLDSHPIGERSFRTILRDSYGLTTARQHKEIEVTILDEDEAHLLKANPGAPALLLTYLSYLRQGVPFEYRRMLVRGDRCKYFVDLDEPDLLE